MTESPELRAALRTILSQEALLIDAETTIIGAYLALLLLPHTHSVRLSSQTVLADCRSFIARRMHLTEEETQNQFEEAAQKLLTSNPEQGKHLV